MNDADQLLNALRDAGENGLLIGELADRLGIDQATVTAMIETLMSEGLVMQKQELKEERYAVKLPVADEAEPTSLSDMDGCPCFHCLRISRCGVRQPDSPVTCNEIEDWMGADITVTS
ncbi:MAG: helix-turn-helix domain-containing protein [Candidatus Thorarchaeota archaeon]